MNVHRLIHEYIRLLVEAELPEPPKGDEKPGEKPSKLQVPKGQVVTLSPGDPVAKVVEPDVFDMIQKSYAAIGGHAKIKSPGDIGIEYPNWALVDVDDDPEPDVARLSSQSGTTGGLKGGAVATDGTPAAKARLMAMLKDFYSSAGNWSEVSGAMANVLIKKLGFKPVSDEKRVRELLGGKEIVWHGDENPEGDNMGVSGWYSRKIGGVEHAKIIVGNV